MQPLDSLPAPASIALRGRTVAVIHAPADAAALGPLLGLVGKAGLRVRAVQVAGDTAGDAAGPAALWAATAGVERVVLAWSAAAAAGPDVSGLRRVTGSATGDRLLVLRLDETPLPPLLAGRDSAVVDRCLRALAEVPVASAPAAVVQRLGALRRVTWQGAGLVGAGAAAAGGVAAFGLPDPAEGPGAQVRVLLLLCALMPLVTGLFVMLWAWLDRWSLARRVASYLVDRELEAR